MPEKPVAASLQQWLDYLQQLHPESIELGLDRVKLVYQQLGIDFSGFTVITVAGTNGKGTVSALIERGLLCAGYSVSTYSSPHLIDFNERLRVDGVSLEDEHWIKAFAYVDQHRQQTRLTFFEFTTLAAMWLAYQAGSSHLILEVGLGGRLDAVNIIDADIAILTSVDYDHQAWLGNTLEEITTEKIGIVKPGCIFISAEPRFPEIINKKAQQAKSFFRIERDFNFTINEKVYSLDIHNARINIQLSIPASHPLNFATALQTLACLLPSDKLDDIAQSLVNYKLLGRASRHRYKGIECIVDVAHNPQSISRLCEELTPIDGRTVLIFGLLKDKNVKAIIEQLIPYIDAWLVCELPGIQRALAANEIVDLLHENQVSMISVSKNPKQALARAMQLLSPGDRLVAAGSFHVAGDILGKIYQGESLPVLVDTSLPAVEQEKQ